MSWITIAWTATITTCLLLAGIYLSVWYRRTEKRATLGIVLSLVGIAGIALVELLLMRSESRHQAFLLLNWANLAVLLTMAGLIGFVYFTLREKNLWVAVSALLLRLLSAVIVGLAGWPQGPEAERPLPVIQFLGEAVSYVAAPTFSSWWFLNEVGNLLFLLFILDASVRSWRHGDVEQKRASMLIGGSILLFTLLSVSLGFLVNHQIIRAPYLVSAPFFLVVLVLIHELSRQLALDARSRELAERKTAEMRNRLQQTERSTLLGHLSSTLVHELGQPLGAILRNTETAELLLKQEQPDAGELRALIRDIRRDNRRATEIIRRMRSLFDRRKVSLGTVNLVRLVEDTVTLLREELHRKGVSLEIGIPPSLPHIEGDELLLQQVLFNLISNALEHLPAHGGGRIRIRTDRGPGATVELSVSDNGTGIPEEVRECLFKPFCTGRKDGMGIGLAIASTIMEAHRGRLWLTEEEKGWTTFRLSLPAHEPGIS